jgi:hypothetical protein
MFSPSNSGTFAKPVHRGSRALVVLGVAAILVNLSLITHMFSQRPVYSEEAEIISGAISKARASMTVEWVSADAKFINRPPKDIIIERKQLFSLYRLRVMVVATEAEVPKLQLLLSSLATANYSNRFFPIDVELHVLGKATGLPPVRWGHGRYDVYVHRLHGNANPSLPFVMMDVWQPQSRFELGLPLTASAVLSPHWFQWVMQVVRQYASTSKDDYFHLEKSEDGQQLLSPLSPSMSGIALGPPVAGTAGNAAATVFSPLPSTTTVFTADFWNALLTQTATGPDVDDVAVATWKGFLGATAVLLSKRLPQFLYPPLAKNGALACDTAGMNHATRCSVVQEITPMALETLLHLPATIDLIPKLQEHEK